MSFISQYNKHIMNVNTRLEEVEEDVEERDDDEQEERELEDLLAAARNGP